MKEMYKMSFKHNWMEDVYDKQTWSNPVKDKCGCKGTGVYYDAMNQKSVCRYHYKVLKDCVFELGKDPREFNNWKLINNSK
jgi:hypothetical protein